MSDSPIIALPRRCIHGLGRARGLTMVELLTVISILAILLSLATPSFVRLIADWRVSTAATAIGGDMRMARAEAMKRSRAVSICPLDGNGACGDASANDWANGWMVFFDNNNDGVRDENEDAIRIQPALPGLAAMTASLAGARTFFPNGLMNPGGNGLDYTITSSATNTVARKVCVSTTGRTVSFNDSSTTCP
ncbi:MAG: GspH/FimT family pseudopilin [Pseudomonadota bacterium]|nr:GspH/FimT family pseudopilin [Pseudomonadota bacterium]